MIRIIHVLGGLDLGGAETMIMNLYRNIDRNVIQFDFVIHTSKHQYFYDEIVHLGGKIYSFPPFKGTNLIALKKRWNAFFVEHPEYKILHSHVRSYASLYIPIAKKHGLTTIAHSHSISNGIGISSIVKKILQYPLRWQADYFFACSKKAGEWLFGKRIIKRNKLIILRNAINLSDFKYSEEKRKEMRNAFHIEDKIVFINVGRLHKSKNHLFLINLFKKIKNKIPNAVLYVVGDGSLKKAITKKIKHYRLEDYITLMGNRTDICDLLQMSDFFLLPSKWEGLGMVAIESQASGTYTICSTRVPDDVCITDGIIRLPLNKRIWIDSITSAKSCKYNYIDRIRKSGYDIANTASYLSDFYSHLVKQNEK